MGNEVPIQYTGEVDVANGERIIKWVTFDDVKDDYEKALNSNAPNALINLDDEALEKIDRFLDNINSTVERKRTSDESAVDKVQNMVDSFFERESSDQPKEVNMSNFMRTTLNGVNNNVPYDPFQNQQVQQFKEDNIQSFNQEVELAKFSHEAAWGENGGWNFHGW